MLVPSDEIIWPVEYYGEKHNTILDKQLFMYLYFDCSWDKVWLQTTNNKMTCVHLLNHT